MIPRRPTTAIARRCSPLLVVGFAALGCLDRTVAIDGASEAGETTTTTSTATSAGSSAATSEASSAAADTSGGTTDEPTEDGVLIDVLVVVDDSASMAQEQAHVAANFSRIVEMLEELTDASGLRVYPSVNIMVTTTDVGHPLCPESGGPGRRGTPVRTGCNTRIASFADGDVNVEDACTDVCPVDVVPTDPFVHFDHLGTNVPDGTPAQALACLGPQGIDGCNYASPLEAMLLALDPTACWNDPGQPGCADDPQWAGLDRPFLRDGATLAIVIISDGAECSVATPEGEIYFTEDDLYWEIHPDTSMPVVSQAVCRNAGVACDGPSPDGEWTGCMSTDNPVLHPVDRYLDALTALRDTQDKDIAMLGIFGVPEVTAHSPYPPFEPTAGGVFTLQPRVWNEADLTAAELDAGITVAHKVWEFGDTAPGCANERANAIFPTRVREVCESLDLPDDPRTDVDESSARCCIESLCDDDYAAALRCLTPDVSGVFPPKG